MPICGPKLSLCGVILSIWGIIQLALMGIFYFVHAVALAEDIPGVNEKITNFDDFYNQVNKGYTQALMGIFYFVHAVALAEDVPGVDKNVTDMDNFYKQVNEGYTQNAYNCWIAALLYIITLAFSAHQFWSNNRSSLSV